MENTARKGKINWQNQRVNQPDAELQTEYAIISGLVLGNLDLTIPFSPQVCGAVVWLRYPLSMVG